MSSIADGISYAEVRINFLYRYIFFYTQLCNIELGVYICRYMIGEDGQENVPHRDWLLTFDRVLNEVKNEMEQQGRGEEFIGARVSLF